MVAVLIEWDDVRTIRPDTHHMLIVDVPSWRHIPESKELKWMFNEVIEHSRELLSLVDASNQVSDPVRLIPVGLSVLITGHDKPAHVDIAPFDLGTDVKVFIVVHGAAPGTPTFIRFEGWRDRCEVLWTHRAPVSPGLAHDFGGKV